ncbi:MAG: hypothetical protein AVDCRST_MAG93-9113 [uncultured Chloroflexia bacterium]|uniref:Uncharacterized protein n=1 Tax=uncultured Chloroflexia bacterium TaxID=1672391 RepID=A0A6J4N7Z8_9CHLR|nr:MAG: hypothetical protein AVDCRST_MAG93-9113 [uncultured Chloroflexia bacterium]
MAQDAQNAYTAPKMTLKSAVPLSTSVRQRYLVKCRPIVPIHRRQYWFLRAFGDVS